MAQCFLKMENSFTVPAFPVEKVKDPTWRWRHLLLEGFAGYLSQIEQIDFEGMKLAVVKRDRNGFILC
jgi:hypothetical protein